MALTQKLELRTSQALVMTPQLMQAIKLLQLSHLDLIAYVENELERNPLLERAEDPDAPAAASNEAAGDGATDDAGAADPDWTETDPGEGGGEAHSERRGSDAAPAKPTASEPSYSEWASVGGGGRDEGYNLEAFVSVQTTLAEHLARQLNLTITDPALRMIGQHLIDLVDEAGYVRGDLPAVAEKLGVDLATVESVLAILQTFDPVGVCARDLPECLTVQLQDRDRFDPAMARLIANLDLVAKHDRAGLRRVCAVDDEDLAQMIAELKALNPKPGLAFGQGVVQPIVPDVFVRSAPDGTWLVELNSDTLPRVLVNQSYYARVSGAAKNEAERAFLSECMQTATWLTRSLDQRAKTILKVASEIVRQQDAFLAHGVRHLRPLNLRTVADAIGMHESTISRVTSNKYIATPRGIFEMKYFFSSAIAATDAGAAHSAAAVRDRIKEMIDAEPTGAVLSDDAIVQQLKAAGIDIARRTVAKYREAMRIPSSLQRRREKQANQHAE